jgi:hypothetical protein
MDIKIKLLGNSVDIDKLTFQKMAFIFNALNDGWSIQKMDESYIFKKNHEGKQEVYEDSYLDIFMKENGNINKLLS